MANWFEKSLEVANYSNLPCLNQMVLANGFLVEQRPIRMAPDELALEISNSRVDLHGHCFIQPGDACFSFIG